MSSDEGEPFGSAEDPSLCDATLRIFWLKSMFPSFTGPMEYKCSNNRKRCLPTFLSLSSVFVGPGD
jgi:hypothetical protein